MLFYQVMIYHQRNQIQVPLGVVVSLITLQSLEKHKTTRTSLGPMQMVFMLHRAQEEVINCKAFLIKSAI